MSNRTFGLDQDTVVKSLNPSGNSSLFKVGPGGVDSTDLDNVIQQKSEYVSSKIRTRYSEWLSRIDDEIIFGWSARPFAGGDEQDITPSCPPIGNVIAWINFPLQEIDWRDRYTLMQSYGTKCEVIDGKIHLPNPLKRGDSLIVEYDHDALASAAELRGYALDLIWAHYARRLPYMNRDGQNPLMLEEKIEFELYKIGTGKDGRGLDFFDRIDHARGVRTTTRAKNSLPTGGF